MQTKPETTDTAGGSPLELRTDRLTLRPPTLDDAEAVFAFCNDPAVSWGGYGIPHPHTVEHAQKWIRETGQRLDEEKEYAFLIRLAATGEVIGDTVLKRDPTHNLGNLGYLLDKGHRGHGYAAEAAGAVLRFAFESLRLNKVEACCWARNAASIRTLERLGFTREGVLREHAIKWGRYEDDVYWGLLRREWEAMDRNEESA